MKLRYHDITKDDMKNGDGLRVVLWVSGCDHHCKGCQNPVTWDPNDGLLFDDTAKNEIYDQLSKPYISGITFSGGDPLYIDNRGDILDIINDIKNDFPDKTIWLYTGYQFEELMMHSDTKLYRIIKQIDVLVDGRFEESLADTKYHWAGSTNQRVIDVQKTIKKGEVVLHESN